MWTSFQLLINKCIQRISPEGSLIQDIHTDYAPYRDMRVNNAVFLFTVAHFPIFIRFPFILLNYNHQALKALPSHKHTTRKCFPSKMELYIPSMIHISSQKNVLLCTIFHVKASSFSAVISTPYDL